MFRVSGLEIPDLVVPLMVFNLLNLDRPYPEFTVGIFRLHDHSRSFSPAATIVRGVRANLRLALCHCSFPVSKMDDNIDLEGTMRSVSQ